VAGRQMGDTDMLAAMVAILDSEWGIIFVIVAVVILFGSTKLPKFARSLGSAQSEFKKGLAEGSKESDTSNKSEPQTSGSEAADAKTE
jgi:sec-independent protein translocase protein TatA